MKFGVIAVCLLTVFALQIKVAHAKSSQEYRLEADQYYLESNFKKAHKIYYKLAKTGDHYSQGQLSRMYARGEGKKTDLEEAYAWSVLAAESGGEEQVKNRDALLQKLGDPVAAQKKAEKLESKYGQQALQNRADLVQQKQLKNFGRCTGSRLNCS